MNQQRNQGKSSRRRFLVSAAVGASAIGLAAGGAVSGKPRSRRSGRSGKVRWRFEARRVEQAFSDGSVVPFFRYVSVGNTRSNGDIPLMQNREGRKVGVSIENNVDFPIQPTILNYESGPVIMPGETAIWNFTMPPAGTWIFTESLLGVAASSAGFSAAMISNPAGKSEQIRDFYLMYQNADDRWNEAIDNGNVPDESVYEPNYHTINALSYPHTINDPSTYITCFLHEQVLLRVANFSNIRQSIHLHGYHAQTLNVNNVPDNSMPPKDTFPLAADTTMDILMDVDQIGEYPVHPHSLTATTDNGLYQGGAVTMINAQPGN